MSKTFIGGAVCREFESEAPFHFTQSISTSFFQETSARYPCMRAAITTTLLLAFIKSYYYTISALSSHSVFPTFTASYIRIQGGSK